MDPRGFALLGTLTLEFCSIGSSPHGISTEGSAGWSPRGRQAGICHLVSRSPGAAQSSGNKEQLLWADLDKQDQSSPFPLKLLPK